MKRVVFAVLVAAVSTCIAGSSVWAGSMYGPASPVSAPGKGTLGFFYNWYGDKWEGNHNFVDLKVGQNQAVVEGAYGLSKDLEIYGRLGGADMTARFKGSDYRLRDDMDLIGTAGARMIFARPSPQFSLGGNLQMNYAFSNYKDRFDYNTLRVKVKDLWDVNLALYGQFQPSRNVLVYAGPQLYYGEFRARVYDHIYGESASATYKPKSSIGAVAGTAFAIPGAPNVKFFAETQYRDRVSVGGGIAYNF
jgi:hypothetical protein